MKEAAYGLLIYVLILSIAVISVAAIAAYIHFFKTDHDG